MGRRLLAQHPVLFERLLARAFFCPSCSTWRLSKPKFNSPARAVRAPRRHASTSTLSSSTAINASKAIPSRYKGLHEALLDVQKRAAAQVNLSRLQLALKGLESETPTIRVAILGINVPDTARRVVRLLLADALESEEIWEKQLTGNNPDYSKGVLIRYGQTASTNIPAPRSALSVLQVPSSILQRNNIEILISSIQPSSDDSSPNGSYVPLDAFLSPMISTPTDASGRQTTISQPVHKSLIVSRELKELLSASQLLAAVRMLPSDRYLVDLAVNLNNFSSNGDGSVFVFDAAKAEDSLALVRSSLGKAAEYTEKWNESGVPSLSKWLTLASTSNRAASLPSSVRNLLSSVLANAASALKASAMQTKIIADGHSIGSATRTNLDDAVSDFSRAAHQELQSGLASAWSSRNWRKLAWYKLFWRVDDVGLIIADLLSNAWLPRTERYVYELSGRLLQIGISPVEFETPSASGINVAEPAQTSAEKPLNVLSGMVSTAAGPSVEPALVNQGGDVAIAFVPTQQAVPIASTISKRRQEYMEGAVSELTSTAQQLVFRTLSITGLTAGLSGLAYFSVTNGSIYEAGTIVALGTAFALRRMQSDWQRSCKLLENGLMETGRDVIRRLEEKMRQLVRDGGKFSESDFELQARQAAEEAVARAQKALNQLG